MGGVRGSGGGEGQGWECSPSRLSPWQAGGGRRWSAGLQGAAVRRGALPSVQARDSRQLFVFPPLPCVAGRWGQVFACWHRCFEAREGSGASREGSAGAVQPSELCMAVQPSELCMAVQPSELCMAVQPSELCMAVQPSELCRAVQPSELCMAVQPSELCMAVQPSELCMAVQPSELCMAVQPSELCRAVQPSELCMAVQPSELCMAVQPSELCMAVQPSELCMAVQPSELCMAVQPSELCMAVQPSELCRAQSEDDAEGVMIEVAALDTVRGHPHIVQLVETVEDEQVFPAGRQWVRRQPS
ncbi:unnamed protein product [Closterium sp. NIES-65]|nr:unnamed protein product [Closterium sp. NIES-65]